GRSPRHTYFRCFCYGVLLTFHVFCLLVISFLLIPSCGRFLPALSSCSSMGRAHIGEFSDQIPVRPYSILRNPSICDESDEGVEYILGERPSINGKGRPARGVIEKEI